MKGTTNTAAHRGARIPALAALLLLAAALPLVLGGCLGAGRRGDPEVASVEVAWLEEDSERFARGVLRGLLESREVARIARPGTRTDHRLALRVPAVDASSREAEAAEELRARLVEELLASGRFRLVGAEEPAELELALELERAGDPDDRASWGGGRARTRAYELEAQASTTGGDVAARRALWSGSFALRRRTTERFAR